MSTRVRLTRLYTLCMALVALVLSGGSGFAQDPSDSLNDFFDTLD